MSAKQAPLEFDPETHTYTKGGVLVPGVTSVLQVLDVYAGIPKSVLEAAAVRGTAVHLATEYDDEGCLDESTVAEELWPYIDAWREFRAVEGFTPRTSEARVFHPKLWYAGTLDCEGEFRGEEAILDKKTVRTLMPSTGPQLAAYCEARNWGRKDKIKRRYAVQLKDDGSYTVKEYNGKADYGLFQACLTVYNWKAHTTNGRTA